MGHFLEFDPGASCNPCSPYAVLPLPYERSASYMRGTARAPAAILDASVQTELYDEELGVSPGLAVQTLPEVDCATGSDADALERIRAAALPAMSAGRFLLSLGGEHTVTVPLVRAAVKAFGPVSVLQVDAHADLRDTYEGSAYSHACAMRRLVDDGLRVAHAGIRSLCKEEARLIAGRGLPVIWARDAVSGPDGEWIAKALGALGPRVYVTVDIDGLDPSLVPGTGTPEPGGLGWYPLLRLLRAVFGAREVVAADIVEVVPVPGMVVSEFVAARLAVKMLAYHRLRDRIRTDCAES